MNSLCLRFSMVSLFLLEAAFGLDKESAFKANRAETYPSKATQGKVTVAVVPFDKPEDIRKAFGKAELARYGVLPVLVVIDNDGKTALKVDLVAEYVTAGGKHLEATPADEIMYLNSPKAPRGVDPSRVPLPIPTRKPKNNLQAWEVTGRAFNVKLIPAGDSVSGFVYFQTARESGARIYLNGFSEAGTGKELFYFEIPMREDTH